MKRALISVTDKTDIVKFCKGLIDLDYTIISTGGTLKVLEENNIACTGISDVTNFPEMLDGRVKTLHPNVFGGILYCRDNSKHNEQIAENNIQAIDLICVNLYEFEKALLANKPIDEMIENIDIGGPSIIRAASKNYKDVIVVTDYKDYDEVLDRIKNDNIDQAYRLNLASKAFTVTGSYDATISRYFNSLNNDHLPETINISLKKEDSLRYGENSHQNAALYKDSYLNTSLLDYKQLNGKELSFNNLNDLYGAISIIREFKNDCVVAAIKHSTPCAVALGNNPLDAYTKAYNADSLSIFGGVIAFNQEVDLDTATKLNETFLEIIAAPSFSDDALKKLQEKKNLRVLKLANYDLYNGSYDIKFLEGKVLVQDVNDKLYDELNCVTDTKPNDTELKDMEFGMKVVKYCKSNAICIVKNQVTLAIGQGQTSRVWALKNAIENNMDKDFTNAVLASDAFFPFNDSAKLAFNANIKAIVQPGGSIKDQDTIDFCNENKMTMTFSKLRHFRH